MGTNKKSIEKRLREGVVIGDGGMIFAMEKRGCVKATASWTSEAAVENPEAVIALHREFLRAGSDVIQTFTFCSSNQSLEINHTGDHISSDDVNSIACRLARKVAEEGDALVAGGIGPISLYATEKDKEKYLKEFQSQVDVFAKNNVDFVIAEYFDHIEEMEWALEVCTRSNMPALATMRISDQGDINGVGLAECAIRMAKAGAVAVGVNCLFDPFVSLKSMRTIKSALEEEKLDVFLICQPLGYLTPDVDRRGYLDLPEYPFALEPRVCTRWDIHKFAREAYDLGIRYIGGCCGFESYHIRAIAQELSVERGGKETEASKKHPMWGGGLAEHPLPWIRAKASRDYWENLGPSSGRPFSSALTRPLGKNNIPHVIKNKNGIIEIRNKI